MSATREAFEPRHAVTYETTDQGQRIAPDQVVTAEADARPKPAPAPESAGTAGASGPIQSPPRRRGANQE